MSVVSFKGTREGLVITLGEGAWRDVLNDLMTQLSRPGAQSFFQGARVFLETGTRALDVTQIEELIALLAQYRMTLVAVSEPSSQAVFDRVRAVLPTPPEPIPVEESVTPHASASSETYALLVHRTVRSGQTYQYAGTIVVIGDVNPGAQLVAEGDVIVWGKLRGVVHAGAAGNDNAMVAALVLAPTQLRIGHLIARAPEEKRTPYFPEVARVREGRIVVEPWTETVTAQPY